MIKNKNAATVVSICVKHYRKTKTRDFLIFTRYWPDFNYLNNFLWVFIKLHGGLKGRAIL